MTLEVQTNRSRIDYAYNATTLTPDTETIGYDLDANGTTDFTRVLDRSQDSLRRDSGWQLKNGGTVENEVAYTYDLANRLSTVASPAGTFTYAYQSNSYNLLASTTKGGTGGSPVIITTNTWESTRDVLDVKENKSGSTVISSYDYGVNSYGQRTGVAQAGTAFTSSRSNDWGYNSKGEVVKADSSISGFDRAFLFDGIGNRKKSANTLTLPSSDNYTTNALNQYSQLPSNSITTNPSYDDDGNATAHPVPAYPSANSTLAWDGEQSDRLERILDGGEAVARRVRLPMSRKSNQNRLITATVNSVATTVLYDAHSRRIAKTTGSTTTLYVYDGWNCIAEYTGTTLARTRTWGTDLSASMQGAGGVGGLLVEKQGTSLYYPTYDGNGNVSEYLDSTGQVIAHFEYDPFGNTVVNTDTGNQFAYRFSTKPLNFATGLFYYGYRYYDPLTGRWPSRDPIEEKGGVNLYGFVGNAPVDLFDVLGNIVYGIDGTWANAETGPMTNTMSFVKEVTHETTRYTPGPGGRATGINHLYAGLTGNGSERIRSEVRRNICTAYCGGDCKVGLVGWSRGAVIAMGVAADLQNIGCDCKGATIKPIKVRFAGLFDAVQMMTGDWPQSVPSNVEHFAHAKKTSTEQWYFPTKDYGGESMSFDLNASRKVPKTVCFGPPGKQSCHTTYTDSCQSNHGDLGADTTTDAYSWIKSKAATAEISF